MLVDNYFIYFSIADVVEILAETVNPKDYIKKMLKRDPELKVKWGTICPLVRMVAQDGKKRMTKAATLEGVFRVIQSIPSKKAEPLKQWLAQVGSQHVDQYPNEGLEWHDNWTIQEL